MLPVGVIPVSFWGAVQRIKSGLLHPEGLGLRKAAFVSVVAGIVCLCSFRRSSFAARSRAEFGGHPELSDSHPGRTAPPPATSSSATPNSAASGRWARSIPTCCGPGRNGSASTTKASMLPLFEETGSDHYRDVFSPYAGQAIHYTQQTPVRVMNNTNQPVGSALDAEMVRSSRSTPSSDARTPSGGGASPRWARGISRYAAHAVCNPALRSIWASWWAHARDIPVDKARRNSTTRLRLGPRRPVLQPTPEPPGAWNTSIATSPMPGKGLHESRYRPGRGARDGEPPPLDARRADPNLHKSSF